MALTAAAVEDFSRGRLDRDDSETIRQLAAAVAAARRYCGWHVTPLLTAQTITLDGPGSPLLVLPTMNLTALTSVTEDGVAVTVADLMWSARGLIHKPYGQIWTDKLGGVSVVISHGYSAAEDFESVIFSAIDRGAFSPDREPKMIGPFQYPDAGAASDAIFTGNERAVLDRYRLEPL